jgi:hypothetical protein
VLSSRMEFAACTKSHGLHIRHSTVRCNTDQICWSAYVRFRNTSPLISSLPARTVCTAAINLVGTVSCAFAQALFQGTTCGCVMTRGRCIVASLLWF